MQSERAPGPLMQWLNELLHQEPYSFVVYGIYWCIVLIVISPLAGVALLVMTAAKTVFYLAGVNQSTVVEPRNDKHELAVLITGCDSGFGCDLALALASRGYVVFAGCLTEEATRQFQGRITPILMDVTKEDQVQAATMKVSEWLKETGASSPRYLHAVVNNAGIGHGGLVDWLDVSSFQQDMDGECILNISLFCAL